MEVMLQVCREMGWGSVVRGNDLVVDLVVDLMVDLVVDLMVGVCGGVLRGFGLGWFG
jgi:hypothetical protein